MSLALLPLTLLGLVILTTILALILLVTSQRPAALAPEVSKAVGNARLRAVSAVASTGLLMLLLNAVNNANPELVGLPLALTPVISAMCGLLVYAVIPARSVEARSGHASSAKLAPRSPLSPGSNTAVGIPATLAAINAVFLVVTGLTGSADEFGRQRVFTVSAENWSNSSGPYPGWYYALPLLITTAALALVALAALRRISSTPAFQGHSLADLDARWRKDSALVVSLIATAGLGIQLGGCILLASVSWGSALTDRVGTPWVMGGWALGVLMILAALGAGVLALIRALTLASANRWQTSVGSVGIPGAQ